MAIIGMKGQGITTISANPVTTQTGTFTSPPAGFTLSREDTEVVARGYPVAGSTGVAQDLATYFSQQTWNVELEFQAFDWGIMQLAFGEHESTTSSLKFPIGKSGTVPAVSTYVITDAVLNGLAVADLKVTIPATSTQRQTFLKVLGSGSPSSGEVVLNNSANTLTFNVAQAGLGVLYYPNSTYSNKLTLGYESTATAMNAVSFAGVVTNFFAPTSLGVSIPNMGKTGGFNFQVGESNTLQFKPVVDGTNANAVRFIAL
jgi:hypothetical protein